MQMSFFLSAVKGALKWWVVEVSRSPIWWRTMPAFTPVWQKIPTAQLLPRPSSPFKVCLPFQFPTGRSDTQHIITVSPKTCYYDFESANMPKMWFIVQRKLKKQGTVRAEWLHRLEISKKRRKMTLDRRDEAPLVGFWSQSILPSVETDSFDPIMLENETFFF